MTAKGAQMAARDIRTLRVSHLGDAALLLDATGNTFDVDVQRRIWAVCRRACEVQGVTETVPGVNNFTVLFDPLGPGYAEVEAGLLALWQACIPDPDAGRMFDIPVIYDGEDLPDVARQCGLTVAQTAHLHAGQTYLVAAIGAMPGFPYLVGLDPRLVRPRRDTPRDKVPEGAVIIGGQQTAIMPCTAPSGWHILGRTAQRLFDPHRSQPALLRAGDRVRFVVADVAQ